MICPWPPEELRNPIKALCPSQTEALSREGDGQEAEGFDPASSYAVSHKVFGAPVGRDSTEELLPTVRTKTGMWFMRLASKSVDTLYQSTFEDYDD